MIQVNRGRTFTFPTSVSGPLKIKIASHHWPRPGRFRYVTHFGAAYFLRPGCHVRLGSGPSPGPAAASARAGPGTRSPSHESRVSGRRLPQPASEPASEARVAAAAGSESAGAGSVAARLRGFSDTPAVPLAAQYVTVTVTMSRAGHRDRGCQ